MIDIAKPVLVVETAVGWQARRSDDIQPLAEFSDRDEAVGFAAGIARAAGGGTVLIRWRNGRLDTLGVSEGEIGELEEGYAVSRSEGEAGTGIETER
jgi:hypothetical protein